MKPEKLEFYGVKSYVDKTVIDFSALLKNGLFGIFGNTGSGKSTILDCIFLALYGQLPKTSSRDDFINVKSGKCYVRFSFSLNDSGIRKTYEVMREFQLKLGRKTPPQPKATLCEIVDGNKIPIEEVSGRVNERLKEIIGLSIDDFEKCIVLPQGEFSAFVTMQRASRLDMISGLFNLSKYGDRLTIRLRDRLSAQKENLSLISGRLEGFSDATDDAVSEAKIKCDEAHKLYIESNEKYLKISDEFSDYEKNYETHKKLSECKLKLSEMDSKRAENERKKQVLNKIDDAVLLNGYVKEMHEKEKETDNFKQTKNGFLASLERAENEAKSYKTILLKEPEMRKQSEAVTVEIEKLKALQTKVIENEKLQSELDLKRTEYNSFKLRISKLVDKIADKKQELSELENSDLYNKLRKKIAVQIDLLIACAQSKFISEEVEFLKSIIGCDTCANSVKERIKKLSELSKSDKSLEDSVYNLNQSYIQLDEFQTKTNELNRQISELQLEKERCELKMQAIKEDGKRLKEQFDNINDELQKLTCGEVLEDRISALILQKSNIENKLLYIKSELEERNSRIWILKSNIAVTETKIENNTQAIAALNEKINAIKEKFIDESEYVFVLSYATKKQLIKHETETFDLDYHMLKETHSTLSVQLAGRDFSFEELEQRRQNLIEATANRDKLNINYNNLLKEYENLVQKSEKRCKIESEFKVAEHEYAIIEELFNAVKNKKFLEYVAEEYLMEIALDAKNTLLSLTCGRYGLVYDRDFFVEDFYLGGERRRVDAVSGGELFLVSLSLALSLSSSICRKSSRPMEFFFLDEGFGSLDSALTEVVMDCLEKLKNSDFSIGIISHVESLKERLSARINVTGAKENGDTGSKVTITA